MAEKILIISNGIRQSRYAVTRQVTTIGRGATSDLVLKDEKASRAHAAIEQISDGYLLRDLNSSNGTWLNGEKLIGAAPLFRGDRIQIGMHLVTVDFGEPRPVEEEELTVDDLVEEDDFVDDGGDNFELLEDIEPVAEALSPFDHIGASDEDAEAYLANLAANLPNQGFSASDIQLADSKGQIVHGTGASRKSLADPGGAVELLRLLLLVCYRGRATDIHIEPRELSHAIRLRIDGLMVDIVTVPPDMGNRISTVVKILCEIDIAQRKLIQEGAFAARFPDIRNPGKLLRVDYRVSYAPAVLGQKLVVRILDSSTAPSKLTDQGLPARMTETTSNIIHRDSGMVLVVGPTGSGKTTTLYSLLRTINLAKRNVVTIEDPVEVHLEGITQIPVDDSKERSFIQVLRSVLRQDPDVILIGEIRDSETARVAMQAAITGHMVFSTLHTRDTFGTIFRLRDLGVEPYMLGQSLQLVIAQRLIRQLCPHCKRAVKPTPEQREALGPHNTDVKVIFEPVGCGRCLGTGHLGRRGYFEMLANNEALTRAILQNAPREELMAIVQSNGFMSLQQSAYNLVAEGAVGFDEVDAENSSV
jgi:type II secretory ATPase GspE/PulE/Tfp pilus assembly ATPase PilB-like protein